MLLRICRRHTGDTLIKNGPWQMLHDLRKTKRSENITSSLLVVISDSGVWKAVQREFKSICKYDASFF